MLEGVKLSLIPTSLRSSVAGIPWRIFRGYSSASTKEKANRNGICERTELLEGECWESCSEQTAVRPA